jgi:hypothetical protein
MQVWAVFEADIDGDSRLHWEFIFIAATLARAQELVFERVQPDNLVACGVHPTMNKDNHYTFVGSRGECSLGYNDMEESCHEPSIARGYVIETHPVL